MAKVLIFAGVAFGAAILLLGGPLNRWVPPCDAVTIGFCVRGER